MKLINKTNRNFAVLILLLLPIASLILYVSIGYFIAQEVDEKLRVDEMRIVQQLNENPSFISMAPLIEVELLAEDMVVEEGIKNVVTYDPIEKEDEPFRELVAKHEIKGVHYLVKVRHSILEDKDFILAIVLAMSAVLLVMFTFLYVLNNKLSLNLWKPFYTNMNRLTAFSLHEDEPLELEDSKIDEFQALKSSLLLLTTKLQQDYKSLKEFTENASHEIQTPLAIILINLEAVLQEELDEKTASKLYVCYQSVKRLSKLNERLLLLTKLDNNQFENRTELNLTNLIELKIDEFQPLFAEKKLSARFLNKGVFNHDMDAVLANMLIVNLLSNIVKHARDEGSFMIETRTDALVFSNQTGENIVIATVFNRFVKGVDAKNSTGLGLAIVKRIVEVSHLTIDARMNEGLFEMTIKKKAEWGDAF